MVTQSLPHPYFDSRFGLHRERSCFAAIHEDHIVRLWEARHNPMLKMDAQTAPALVRMAVKVRELINNGYRFHIKKEPDLFAVEDSYSRLFVQSFERTEQGLVLTGETSNDVYLVLNIEHIEDLLRHCAEDMEIWFRICAAFFDEIEPQHRGKDDLFRNLKDFTFAGRTWLQQRTSAEHRVKRPVVSAMQVPVSFSTLIHTE
jgi:hypothetical protein